MRFHKITKTDFSAVTYVCLSALNKSAPTVTVLVWIFRIILQSAEKEKFH
jgi:hypothetical protein